jgi:hypothetical protein
VVTFKNNIEERKREEAAAAAAAAAAVAAAGDGAAAAPPRRNHVHDDLSLVDPAPFSDKLVFMQFLQACWYNDAQYIRCDLHDKGAVLFKSFNDSGHVIKTSIAKHFQNASHHTAADLILFNKACEGDAAAMTTLLDRSSAWRAAHGDRILSVGGIKVGADGSQQLLTTMLRGVNAHAPSESQILATLFFMSTRLPWRAAGDIFFRHMLSTMTSVKIDSINEKALRTKGLAAVYNAAVRSQVEEMQEAPAVGISFDGWSMLAKRRCVLGIVFTYVDGDFRQRAALLSAPAINSTHSASNVAIMVAKVVQRFTSPYQILYTTMTDTASNMMNAGAQIVADIAELSNDEPTTLLDDMACGFIGDIDDDDDAALEAAAESGMPVRDCADDSDDVDAGADDESINMSHEAARAAGCVGHLLALMTGDTIKEVPELKALVDSIDRIVSAMSMSEKRKSMLLDAQSVLKISPKPLIRRPPTRWHVLARFLLRYAHCHGAIVILFAHGMFAKVQHSGEVLRCPTDDAPLVAKSVAALFELLEHSGRVLEGSTYSTMAFVPIVLRELLGELSDNSHDAGQPPLFGKVRRALLKSGEARLLPLLKTFSPGVVAAVMHPLTARFLVDIISHPHSAATLRGESDKDDDDRVVALDETVAICGDWYARLALAEEDAAAARAQPTTPPPPPRQRQGADAAMSSASKLARHLAAGGHVHVEQRAADAAIEAEAELERRATANRAARFSELTAEGINNVKALLREFCDPNFMSVFSMPDRVLRSLGQIIGSRGRGDGNDDAFSFVADNQVRASQTALKDFYTGSFLNGLGLTGAHDGCRRLRLLARCVLATTAMSAVVESVFSLGSLLDTSLRNRITPENFEKLLVASYAMQRLKAEINGLGSDELKAAALKKFVALCREK